MERIPSGIYAETIEAALDLIPSRIREVLRCDYLCGVNPTFAGLHKYELTKDGRLYAKTAHVALEEHQRHLSKSNRVITVVLPEPEDVWVVVHELGHVLHRAIEYKHVAVPVTKYATVNHHEAFAEAFTMHYCWSKDRPQHHYGTESKIDPATRYLFEALEKGH